MQGVEGQVFTGVYLPAACERAWTRLYESGVKYIKLQLVQSHDMGDGLASDHTNFVMFDARGKQIDHGKYVCFSHSGPFFHVNTAYTIVSTLWDQRRSQVSLVGGGGLTEFQGGLTEFQGGGE